MLSLLWLVFGDAREDFIIPGIRFEVGAPSQRYLASVLHFRRRPAAYPERGKADAAGGMDPLVGPRTHLQAVFPLAISTF
jgi:hypothetical protein